MFPQKRQSREKYRILLRKMSTGVSKKRIEWCASPKLRKVKKVENKKDVALGETIPGKLWKYVAASHTKSGILTNVSNMLRQNVNTNTVNPPPARVCPK
jgi:hypothetical protein